MKLILPEQITEVQYNAYLADWGTERIVPIASANPKGLSFEDWRAESIKRRVRVPKGYVPETLFFLTDDNETKLLGAIDIRHSLNDYLLQFGGHIGYGIVPSERRKGYAKVQLALALPIAHAMGLQKVLITCADTNIGSAKTIESAGGVLENKVEEEGVLTRRYWVQTSLETLETERLVLRPWTVKDAPAMYAYAVNPKIGPAAGWAPHQSIEETEELLENWVGHGETIWAITEKSSGLVIGSIGLHKDAARSDPRSRMIGYCLREESWGQGYMPEAVNRLTRYAFENLCMQVVSIKHYKSNRNSRRVIEKCGYHYEGTVRGAGISVFGTHEDDVLWSMTREEYFAGKEAKA